MVNVPPLLCSTPPPIDFGDEDDSGLQSTLNLEDGDEFSDFGLVTEVAETDTNEIPNGTCDLELPTNLPVVVSDLDYMTRITPPPYTKEVETTPKKLKPVEAYNYDVAYESEFCNEKNDKNDIGNFQHIIESTITHNEALPTDVDEQELANNDNVPSLRLDSLSLYSNESVSSATLSLAMPLDVPAKTPLHVLTSQVTLEDVSDDSCNEVCSPKKPKSLIISENADDFFAIEIVGKPNKSEIKEAIKSDSEVKVCTVETVKLNVQCDTLEKTYKKENSNHIDFTIVQAVEPMIPADDFGDFANFTSVFPTVSTTAITTINQSAQIRTHISDVHTLDEDDFDDFQNFVSISAEIPKTIPCTAITNTITVAKADGEAKAIDKDDDDDDDFGDFSEAIFEPTTVATNLVVVSPPPPPAVANLSIIERVKPVLQMMFPTTAISAETHSLKEYATTHITNSLKFTAIEQAKALDYQWSTSEMRHSLIRSLGIDSRNILFGEKWNPNMPRYAANLSFDPLKPLKPQTVTSILPTTSTTDSIALDTSNMLENVTLSNMEADWQATESFAESHVQTLQLEQQQELDQLMMVAIADKINLDYSNYSYSSATINTTTTTAMAKTTATNIINAIETTMLINTMDLLSCTTEPSEQPNLADCVPFIVEHKTETRTGTTTTIILTTITTTTITITTTTTTTTTTTSTTTINTFSTATTTTTNHSINNNCSINAPITTMTLFDETHLIANHERNTLLMPVPVADFIYTKRILMDSRSDANQTAARETETFQHTKLSEFHATDAGQKQASPAHNNISSQYQSAYHDVYAAADNADDSPGTSPAHVTATTAAPLSPALSTNSNGYLGNFELQLQQQQHQQQQQQQKQQHFDVNNLGITTAATTHNGSNCCLLKEPLTEPQLLVTTSHCGDTVGTAATYAAMPMKETHIYTPSKSDTAVAKTTTIAAKTNNTMTVPIDFDYEIASAGIIIDETVVKKEYRDVEYKLPFEVETPTKLTAATTVTATATAVTAAGNNFNESVHTMELLTSAAVNDDDFSDFQCSLPSIATTSISATTQEKSNIQQSNSQQSTFGEQMILSPAILLPQAIPMAKPSIEWGDKAVININPDELARIEELFAPPKRAERKLLNINGAVEDDDWSDFVSVPVGNRQQQRQDQQQQQLFNDNNVNNNQLHYTATTQKASNNAGHDDEWSDFISSAPVSTATAPQFNSAAWQHANCYNNPLSFYQQNQHNAHSNIVPNIVYKYQKNLDNNNINNANIINKNNINNSNTHNQNHRQNIQQQQVTMQQPQQIHIMHDFSTVPVINNAITTRNSHQITNQFNIGNSKISPRISLIPDLSFVAPTLPASAGAFMSSLPKPTFSAKK